MNDNNVYIVQCTRENFDDVQYVVQMFARIVDIDPANRCIRTFSLDSTMKKRLCDLGASFWEEPHYAVAKTATRQRHNV